MHVAEQLRHELFAVELDGRPATREHVLPGWTRHDRFGIVVDRPLGALGASHLIQLATTAFYDALPERRQREYPEIYAFHVGGRYGDLSSFDFWPARREVFLPDDPRDVLEAINDRAITHLAVVDGPGAPTEHRPKEAEAALGRLVGAWAYSPSGSVPDGELSIRGTDRRTEANVAAALHPERVHARLRRRRPAGGASALKEEDRAYVERTLAREGEVAAEALAEAVRTRDLLRTDGLAAERYRRATPLEALHRLGPGPRP